MNANTNANNATENETFGWDDQVDATATAPEYIVLEPGLYSFTVQKFERKRFKGSAKMQPCSMAELQLQCTNGKQIGNVFVHLYLCRSQAWKINKFFKCCSLLEEEGDELQSTYYPWDKVTGARGVVKIKQREYNGKTYNDVESFLSVSEQAKINVDGSLADAKQQDNKYGEIEF